MRTKTIYTLLLLLLAPAFLLIPGACKESFVPPVLSTNAAYLVVEGFINNGPDSSIFNLTRSYKLDDTAQLKAELGAQLDVEGTDNSSYPLTELGNGQYTAPGLSLNSALQYRLHIRTANGKEYLSDFVPLRTSPPIDSISWTQSADGVQIYATTHDPQNNSHYYHWDFQQTWEFHAPYFSVDEFVNGNLEPRYVDSFYTCWQYETSHNVLLASSAKLARDLIPQYQLISIPTNSWMISVRYSILVKQYVLTSEAYDFWSDLQKNSEQIGTVFSPEPFQTKGNIHSTTDSSETVIGFISAGTLQKQRIFITPGELANWKEMTYGPECVVDTITRDSKSFQTFFVFGGFWPIGETPDRRELVAERTCVDCTTVGTNIKPAYWP